MSAPWPDAAAFGPEGLSIAGLEATELARRHGTPLLVIDEEHVRARCRAFRDAFGNVLWAVKSFPAGALIRIALEEGLGLLASTGGELDACLRAGAPGERIVLHGNNKLDAELESAVTSRVGLLIADNEEELLRLDAAAAAADLRQRVLLRVVPGIDVETHAYVATGMLDTKFGIPLAGGMAMGALKRALELPALEVVGIHLHLGSQLLDPRPYELALDVALDFLAEARDGLGFTALVLDAGGGMGVRYTEEPAPDPAALAEAMRGRLAADCRERGLPVPQLVVEPGRALVSNAAVTLYSVGAIKEIPSIRTYVAVDGGMSDNIRPALYGSRYVFALAGRASRAEPAPVTVVGRHCESGDVLARDVELPGDLRRGDLLAVASTGAYEYAMASTYNKVGRPEVVMAREGRSRVVLRRETLADLAALESPGAAPVGARRRADVEVRPAAPKDARQIVELVAAVAQERRFIRTEEPQRSPGKLRPRLRHSWTPERSELVAVADDRIVGHLGIARDHHPVTSHVASLGMAVAEPWRGRGVGTALLAEAFRWARWAGVEKLALSVFPNNEAAIGLYRKFGFVEEGRLARHSKKSYGYEDEIVMGAWVG